MYKIIKSIQNKSPSYVQYRFLSSLNQKKTGNESDEPPTELAKPSSEKYDVSKVTKDDMKWRTAWHQKEGQQYESLRTFYSEDNQTSLLKFIHSEIDLRPSTIKKWWTQRKIDKEIIMQSYLPERHQTLGNELAAAHFIVHRGGAVKFYGQDHWIKADKYQNYTLPRKYDSEYILQAIDCTDMNLYYEGLSNLRNLRNVEWLSFNGVENLDDWFLDRISNVFSHSLVYLDVRNCPNYSERGLGALYKAEKLKILHIDDMLMTTSFEMTCLMLQEVNPHLDIKVGD